MPRAERRDPSCFGRVTASVDGTNPKLAAMHPQTDVVIEEIPMTTNPKNAPLRTAITMKEDRARDAALARQEYEAEQLAVRANTARLRALRLAKEAGEKQPAKTKAPAKEDR